MKKIVCILWHQIAPVFQTILPEVEHIAQYTVYSARAVDQQQVSFEQVCRDLAEADFALLGTNSGDNIWPQILDQVKKHQILHGLVGNAGDIHDYRTLEISAACDSYYAQGGKENYRNLLLLCARYAGCEDIAVEPPKPIPWQGFFHPKEPSVSYPDAKSYFEAHPGKEKGIVALLTSRQNWNNGVLQAETLITELLEEKGYTALPMYSYYMADDTVGALGMTLACKKLLFDDKGHSIPNAVIKLSGTTFPKTGGDGADVQQLLVDLNCPIFRPILSTRTSIQQWQEDTDGTLKDIAWSIALPEMDGCIEPLYIGGIETDEEGAELLPVRSRCTRLVDRVIKWIRLQHKKNHDKKVVFILNNNPCASVEATVGAGANLDTLESVARLLNMLQQQGYKIQNPPKDGKELIETIMQRKAISEFRWTTVEEIVNKGGCVYRLPTKEYQEWFSELPERARKAMIEGWGEPPGQQMGEVPPSMIYEDTICITGVQFGNALVCVQPKRGCAGSRCDGTVCRVLHDPHIPPTHQYYATYQFFERKFGADFIVHVGTHGNLEFLPGRGSGLSDACFPDVCIGSLPNIYLYNADNPPEATVAKRRALATVVDHMQTTFVQSGLYDELEEIDQLIAQYKKLEHTEPAQAQQVQEQILTLVRGGKLAQQVNAEKHLAHKGGFDHLCKELHRLLSLIRNTQMQDGMHIFGEIPKGDRLTDMIYSILRYESGTEPGIRSCLCDLYGFDFPELLKEPQRYFLHAGMDGGKLLEVIEETGREVVRRFLQGLELDASIDKNTQLPKPDSRKWEQVNELRQKALDIRDRVIASDETEQFVVASEGGFIAPGPGGAITRGRYDVLPTGRNIYSLDPDVVPTKAAWMIGIRLADAVLEKYLNEEGRYPESFGIYWMCNDIMWADGEGMAQLLYLIGVRPIWQPNGKVMKFEVISLEKLGRPRIDIQAHVSGILRDNFSSRMDLLDEAVRFVAQLDEPEEMNYLKKHTKANLKNGMDFQTAATRIFGARPGAYLNGISLQVFASAWTDRKEMLDVYTFFNGYSYSKGNYGEQAYKALQNSLRTLDITYNKVVSDEHDLLTCSCYFGVQGGMTAAAEALSGKKIQTYYGDSREVYDVKVRTLTDELNRVVQTKLLNPVWIEGQKRHGYKGAGDISKRVGRVYGWEATTDAVGDWVFDEICKTFIQNQENFQFFKEHNPWAMEEMQRRLVEAAQRGLWEPGEGIMESLQDSCLEIEGILEESMGDAGGSFQGNSIDVKGIDELNQMKQQLSAMKEVLKD